METQDADAASGPSSSAPDGGQPAPLRWPPPGLARLQGDVYGAARWLGAGAVLILPLLWGVVSEQDPWSLGPLAGTLWLAFLLGIVGIPIVLGGYIALARLLRRASEAVGSGHQLTAVALVATDHRRDTGFLLQGARAYGLLSPATRQRLARNRLLVGGLVLFAALWLSLGFGIAVVLAARGLLGPWGVGLLTLVPPALAGAGAVVGYGWQEGILRRCRKRWFGRSWSQELAREEIREWRTAMAERGGGLMAREEAPDAGGGARTALRASYVALAAATVVAFVPVFTLIFSAAIIPVLAQVSVPSFDTTVERFASVEPLRTYTLAPIEGITAGRAGEALHTLLFVGRPYRATQGVLPPAREYPQPWFPRDDPAAPPPSEWLDRITTRMGEPLPPDEEAYLVQVASHPAHDEFVLLARAASLDVTSARWSMPLPSDITLAQLSMPALGTVREAAYAHLALAAIEASRGQVAAADTTIREVLSAGLLMAEESPSVLDNLIGLAVVRIAGEALESLYTSTGHPDAAALAWGVKAARRSVDRARADAIGDVEATLRAMPRRALDTTFVRGVRWEYVGLLNTLGPCINLRRVVFGPDAEYRDWLGMAEDRLVRYPAEAELFAVARGGLLGAGRTGQASLPTRILALTMGGSDETGSCARVLGEVVGF